MQETYRFFIDAGADVVINHHQHCYSGYEVYHDKPIFYGLGNFCFDWKGKKNGMWNEGFFITLHFSTQISFEITPFIQCAQVPGVLLMNTLQREVFEKKLSELNDIISDSIRLQKSFKLFSESRYRDLKISVIPYSNRYLRALCNRFILPSFMTKNKRLILLNYIACEAHRDTFIEFLNK